MQNKEISIYVVLRKFLQQLNNITILEAGVHWGEDTRRLHVWLKNKIKDYHCFEPDLRNYKKAKKLIKEFGYKAKLNHLAISDTVGVTDIYLSDGIHEKSGNQMTGSSSIRKPKVIKEKQSWINFDKVQQVKTTTIDEYCKAHKIKKIDFIWADIQGSEYDMIVGAKEMLPHITSMFLEYSYDELYEGQQNLDKIMELLGPKWQIVAQSKTDVFIVQ